MKVHTAEEGVLKGSVRSAVLQACQAHDVPVRLIPPRADDLSQWEGALISSTSRLAMPLDSVRPAGGGPATEFGKATLAHDIASWVAEGVGKDSVLVVH